MAGDGSSISNLAGGLFLMQNNSQLNNRSAGLPPVFHNLPGATIRKLNSVGTSTFGTFILRHAGALEVESGIVQLEAVNHLVTDGAKFSGKGVTRFVRSTVTLTGTNNLAAGATVELGTSAILNGDSVFAGPGTFNWSGGALNGSGTTTISAETTLRLSSDEDKKLHHGTQGNGGRVLNVLGTVQWIGLGKILGGDGSLIQLQRGSSFVALNDSTLTYLGSGGVPALNLLAGSVFRKAGGSNSTVFGSFVVNDAGAIDTAAGAIEFQTANHQLKAGARFMGTNPVRVTSGIISLNGDVTLDKGSLLELAPGGVLNGTGAFSGEGTLLWTGGSMNGSGTTTIGTGIAFQIKGAADKSFFNGSQGSDGRKIHNFGTVQWSDSGRLLAGDGAIFFNRAGGIFLSGQNAAFTYSGTGGLPLFTNEGTMLPGGIFEAGSLAFNSAAFAQGPQGKIVVKVGGRRAGVDYDQITVSGDALIGGALSARLMTNGFLPSVSDQFTVLRAGTLRGTFSQFTADQNLWTPKYTNNSVILVSREQLTFFEPRPYLSQWDSPFINSILSSNVVLETFEDGLLNASGVAAPGGKVIPPGFEGSIDSVDADDGLIDGSGLRGHSFTASGEVASLTFSFTPSLSGAYPTAVGLVWTDGSGSTTFEAFDRGSNSLGVIGPFNLAAPVPAAPGSTSDDRFLGLINEGGVSAVRISNSGAHLEIDHLQFGRPRLAASADLGIFTLSAPEFATVGANYTYTIAVTNRGPAVATRVMLTDDLPSATTLVTALVNRASFLRTNNQLIVTLPNLPPGTAAAIQLTLSPGRTGLITNNLAVAAAETDPNKLNNNLTTITRVGAGTPPVITLQPADALVVPGATARLEVSASGTAPLRYQWKLNGVALRRETNSVLIITNFQASNAGRYRVSVANDVDTIDSAVATLLPANISTLPMTNNFAARVAVNDLSRTGLSSNVGATIETGEPLHAGKRGGKSMWLTWVAPASGIATFSTAGSSFDTLLGVYTGEAINGLTEIISDDDEAGFQTSQVKFNALTGVRYQIAVDGLNKAQGNILLTWTLEPTVDVQPPILVHPLSQTVGLGASVSFSVVVSGTGFTFQWSRNRLAIPGATNDTLTISNVQRIAAGLYSVRVTRGQRFIDSRVAALQINRSALGTIVERAASSDKFADLVQAVRLVRTRPELSSAAGRLRRKSSLARGYSGTQIFNTFGSESEEGEPNHCGVVGGASQWFAYEAASNGQLSITTDGSDFDTVIAVYTGEGEDFDSLIPVACDNNSGLDGRDSSVVFSAVTGTVYYIAIDGVNGATGTVELNYNLIAPPGLRLLGRPTNGVPAFQLSGLPGRTFTIEMSNNLLDWNPLITTNVPSGVADLTDPISPSVAPRFYRATMAP